MTIAKEFRAKCDGCGYNPEISDNSAVELRAYLKKLGWDMNYWTQEDFCAECVEDGVQPDYSKDLSGEFE